MRYGRPAIRERIDALKAQGCERILIAPLYPQYCAATTATANDEAFAHLRRLRWQPALRTLPPYMTTLLYRRAEAVTGGAGRARLRAAGVIASFHGMPQRTLELGDPYHCHCRKTARLLSDAMGRELTSPSSRASGRAKVARARDRQGAGGASGEGVTKVAIVAPGFLGRLPRDAGGAGDPRPRDLHRGGGHPFRLSALPQRQRPGIEMLRS
jgi:ferrochelatase